MKSGLFAPVVHAEILDGGVLVTFRDATGSFISTKLLHDTIDRARELPEFWMGERASLAFTPFLYRRGFFTRLGTKLDSLMLPDRARHLVIREPPS
jgi:hypothetical protein